MYTSIARENRNKKAFKVASYTKKLYQYELLQCLFTWWWLHWRKNKETIPFWETIYFFRVPEEHGIYWPGTAARTKKQGQWQRLWQQLKADVSGKGEIRSQHTQVVLPEPQHKTVMGTHLGFISDAALLYSCLCRMVQHGFSSLHLIVCPASA